MAQMGLPCAVTAPVSDECIVGDDIVRNVVRIAREKAESVLPSTRTTSESAAWVLAADTVIELDGRVLGKPRDREDARTMLSSLAGRTHRVITGVCIARGAARLTDSAETLVEFAGLSDAEIEWYLASCEWEGVAGAYRIQGRGACLIERIDGSYSNVMGLPIRLVYGMLTALNYPFR